MKHKNFSLRRLLSILLVTAILATQVIVSGASIVNAETIPIGGSDITTVFQDDFNRSDRDINGDNGWISNYQSKSQKIVDNSLSVYDYSDQNGIAVCYTKRPEKEASILQRVNVDVKNPGGFTYYSSANVHLRYVADAGASGPAQNYYVSVTKQSIKIGKVCGDWSSSATKALDNGGKETFYVYNGKNDYCIEFIAEGTNPTTLTATLYDKTAGVAVATVSGTDSQAELQQAGTVALSTKRNGAGQDTAIFDNFEYEYLVTDSEATDYPVLFFDDLTRDNDVIGNDWNIGKYTNATFNENGELQLTTAHPANDFTQKIYDTALMRPSTEASLNQVVSVDFKSLATVAGTVGQGPTLIARCQDERPNESNHYSARLFASDATNLRLWIYRGDTQISDSTAVHTSGGMPIDKKYRVEFSVTSIDTTTTKLVAKLYQLDSENNPTLIYTKQATDSTPELQNSGTVGFSVYDKYGIKGLFNDFCVYPINDWNKGALSAISFNKNGELQLTTAHPAGDDIQKIYDTALMRPSTEASLNQVVSVDFKSLANTAGTAGQGPTLIARCQDERPNGSNHYSARLFSSDKNTLRLWIYRGDTQLSTSGNNILSNGGMPIDKKYRVEFTVTSINSTTTNLVAKLYLLDSGNNPTLIYTEQVTDTTPELQKPGTVGFSVYDKYGTKGWLNNFKYSPIIEDVSDTYSFEKDNDIFKTFEAEAVETYRYNYKKTLEVDSASDNAAAIQNIHSSAMSYETLTDELVDTTGYVVYNITADSTANYPVKLRYRFGSANESEYNTFVSVGSKVYAPIIVNGQKYKIETSCYGEFATTAAYEIPLVEGNNTIYCLAPTAEIVSNISGAYIDYDCLLVSGDVKVTAGNIVSCDDVNGDNEVNIIDLVRMKKYIAGTTYSCFNSSDLTKLRKYFLDSISDSELKEMSWPKFAEANYPTEAEMLNNTYYKLNVSKKLNVAYLGGSVTVGQMASTTGDVADTPWRQLTFDWLCEQYPDATITQTNGAVGGTGSSYGLENVVEKLKLNSSTEKPDLIFIEYAVNDYYNGENSASVKNNMEWIIRTIYTYAPDADIMIVLTGEYTNLNLDYETKVAHKWIAERFKLPCISVASMLWDDMVEENNGNTPSVIQWKKYFANNPNASAFDWVHPNNEGYQKYAGYIIDYMASIFEAKEGKVPESTVNSFIPITITNDKQTPLPVKEGDYEFLDNTFYKLTNEKKINVAYFGGSITYGTGATNPATDSWRALTTKWIEETYNAQVIENNAAIGGTGTAYGIYRAVDHLKLTSETEKPDLVFIDFAINDVYDGTDYATAKANMEAIVRTIYEYSPKAEIIILLTTDGAKNSSEYDQYRAHKEVAEKFNLPYIAIGKMLWVEENGNYSNWIKHFLSDGVHPNNSGHAKYASYVISYLESTLNSKKAVLSNMMNVDISDVAMGENIPENTLFKNFKGQTAPAGTEIAGTGINAGILRTISGTNTAQFTIKFTGTDLSFWVYKTTTSGDLTISVDGGEANTVSLYRNGDTPKIVPIVSGLEDTEHTVTVILSPSAYGSYMQIHGCMIKSATDSDIVLS